MLATKSVAKPPHTNVIVAPSVDEIYRLDLPHVPGLSLLDHPEAKRTADGRVAVTAYVTDEGRAALCARGCTASRSCEIRMIRSTP
jgi:hypothetical protein